MITHLITYKTGIKKIINLSLAHSIQLKDNNITINYPPNYNGLFMFGSGSINCNQTKEEIIFETKEEAAIVFENIQKKLE